MPYRWTSTDQGQSLTLWAHNALAARGFVVFVGTTSALLAMPLIALIGSPVVWVLLPFLLGAIAAIWIALRSNNRARQLREEMLIGPQTVGLRRIGPTHQVTEWQANRYWVKPVLTAQGGPVPQYLTLRGGPREVELGAFLTEDERIRLYGELLRALGGVAQA
jgi:uncharacterized membrane protein